MKKRHFWDAAPAMLLGTANRLLPDAGQALCRRYVFIADLHTDADPYRDRTDVLRLALSGVSRSVPDARALIMAGDITNCGDEKEYALLTRLLAAYLRAGVVVPAIGNHDAWHHSDDPDHALASRLFQRFVFSCSHPVQQNYYAVPIDRFRFILLGSEAALENQAQLSAPQLEWFAAELSAAVQAGQIPAVVCHQPLEGHNGVPQLWENGGLGEQSAAVEALLRQTARESRLPVFYFSGHLHGLGAHSIEQPEEKLWLVNLPSFEYPSGERGAGCGFIADVYYDYIDLYGYDFIRQEKIPALQRKVRLPI